MTAVEAREPRKVRRARTRAAFHQRRLAAARTPAERADVELDRLRAALARPEVTDRQRDRAWSEVSAVVARLTAAITPRNHTPEVHTADLTARDASNAQTRAGARAREPRHTDYGKSPTGDRT